MSSLESIQNFPPFTVQLHELNSIFTSRVPWNLDWLNIMIYKGLKNYTMKKKWQLLVGVCLFSTTSFSQFIVKNVHFETTGVSNQGKVAGYESWAGPYSIWTPETQGVVVINGLAPGNGVGGQAKFSNDGTYLCATSQGVIGPEMSRYNALTNTWAALGSLGFAIDNTFSGGYTISGDGTTVAGNAWADTTGGYAYTHAIAWNQANGIIDLGTLFFGKSTRANAMNNDASVIVGWQDFNGPWKSAVWRKNIAGTYDANEYLLIDPAGSASDEFNQLGECTAISGDGSWIGGQGDFATNGNPWLWNATNGYIDLGNLSPTGTGYVAGINENGTIAVGRIQQGPWDPELPFIWTPTNGIQNFNDYVTNTLGLNTGTKKIYSANCMSEDGFYVAGYGVDTVSFDYFTYRVSMGTVGIAEMSIEEMKISPNPANSIVQIANLGEGKIEISNVEGKIIFSSQVVGSIELNVSNFESGVYHVNYIDAGTQLMTRSTFMKVD